jgi:hypothetical protein
MQRHSTSHAKTQSKPHAAEKRDEPRAGKHEAPAGVQTVEPEDPASTGCGPSSQKELLEHNIRGGHAQQHPATPAGQHATGSFTGKSGEPKK